MTSLERLRVCRCPGTVIGGARKRITVLFDEFAYRALSMAAVHEHGLLEVTEAVA
ncbi:hypothetical protein [Mycobacterium sp. E2733]|uniref:hypothetical protein n=1 Tax=Mycobacterium sp. E2733 TaxID=1834138 RepID=UPI000AC8B435|nr:hypothetical protein [Mycobacterium sp. E2733]